MEPVARSADAGRPVPSHRPHIALVGLSGTGKTTLAPLLAGRRHLAVVDLDREIEQRAGATAAALFAERGEEEFRDLESEVLRAALDGPPAVIATGGGVVVRPGNRSLLALRSTVVWLRADVESLVARLRGSPQDRPLLAGDPATALRRLARERDPLYEEVADLVVDAASDPAAAIAELVDRELPA